MAEISFDWNVIGSIAGFLQKNLTNFRPIQIEFNQSLLERFRVRASEPLAFQSVCGREILATCVSV
jgi:hypothetical protein